MQRTASRRRWVSTVLAAMIAASVVTSVAAPVTAAGPHQADYEHDATLTSGEKHWLGHQLYVEGAAGDETYELRAVEDGRVGQFLRQVRLDGNAATVLETDSLAPGEYVLLDGDGDPVVTDESGVRTGGADVESASFAVVEQTLETRTDGESVAAGSETEVVLDSNRVGYAVEVTADGLSAEEVAAVFGGTETDDGARIEVTDGVLAADVSGLDPGDYEFEIETTDTDATSTFALTVTELAEPAIEQRRIGVTGGDVAEIDLTVPQGATATLHVGSTDVGYLASVEFEDDGDGDVTLSTNTSLAGNHTGEGERAAWSADGAELREVTLHTRPLSDPLAPAFYDVNLTVEGTERDVGVLAVNSTAVTRVTTHTAPTAEFDAAELTRTDRVAAGDPLVARIDGAGLSSLLAAQSGDTPAERFRSLVTSDDAAFTMAGPEGDERTLEGDRVVARDGTLYVVLEDSSLPEEIRPGSSYELAFTVSDGEFVDEEQTATSSVALAERSIAFDREDGGEIAAAGDATISGTTTVAAGTDVEIRVEAGETVRTAETTVGSDRTFTASVDLSEVEAGSDVSITAEGFDAEVTAEAVDSGSGDTPTTTEASTDDEATESTPTDSEETRSTPTEETTTGSSESGPGFGAALAVLALLGLGLLAVRRRD